MSGAGVAGALLVWAVLGPRGGATSTTPRCSSTAASLALYTAFLLGSFPLEISLTSQGQTKHSALVYLVSDAVRAAAMVVPLPAWASACTG